MNLLHSFISWSFFTDIVQASPIESGWTAIAFVGCIVSVVNIIMFWGTAIETRRRSWPTEQERILAMDIADEYVWDEAIRFMQHLPSFAIGVWAMLLPPFPSTGPGMNTVYGAAVLTVIVGNSAWRVFASLRSFRAWRRRRDILGE